MGAGRAVLLVAVCAVLSGGVCAGTRTYFLAASCDSAVVQRDMAVVQNNSRTKIVWRTGGCEESIVNLEGETKFLDTVYLDSEGIEVLSAVYDHARGKVYVSGRKKETFSLKDKMFEAEGIFYIFEYIHPGKGEDFVFNVLQSEGYRVVEMYLKAMDTETIDVGGKETEAFKYEMGLTGILGATFWPHKYYYWYDADHRFLKYQGRAENGKMETVERAGYAEE